MNEEVLVSSQVIPKLRFSRSERLAAAHRAVSAADGADSFVDRCPAVGKTAGVFFFFFFKTIKRVSGSLLFGWPGDEVWS